MTDRMLRRGRFWIGFLDPMRPGGVERRCARPRLGLSALAFVVAGCGAAPTPQQKPPSAPPTPESVTRVAPGGDASDPHRSALERLLRESWGARSDRDEQVRFALPDADNWKRVRYWGVEHFVGFRYGKVHHAMVVAFVQDSELEQPTSEDCLRRFEAWGRPQIRPFDVEFGAFRPQHSKFRDRSLIALSVDGSLSLGFSRPKFSAAWAAFAIYPKACLVAAVAVPWRETPELAAQVRDRFVKEGFGLVQPLTDARPVRKTNGK